jgi:Sporulation related domain.
MRYILVCISLLFATNLMVAQNNNIPDKNIPESQDSTVVINRPPLFDTTLTNVSIFSVLQNNNGYGSVHINQSNNIISAYNIYVKNNAKKKLSGYRIRIYFNNKQSAREESSAIEKRFVNEFPLIPTYRDYTNPFFRVSVGDYRTKTDAIIALKTIKELFPQAVIIKDFISYPAL